MDFKVEITCHNCKCKFQLRPVWFAEQDDLSCPNCGKEIDEDVFLHLKSGLKELALVPTIFPENASVFSAEKENQIQFTFDIKECDILGNET